MNYHSLKMINSYLINSEQMEKNPNLKGEYNVPRYVEAFNKKVEPLLVVFRTHIRESLLITDPSEKQFFTSSELELVSGIASKEGDQDTLEELMTISEEENRFWKMKGISPENRKARFVCCIKVVDIEIDFRYEFIGYSEGMIMDNIYGSKGFGYDPIFKPLGYNVSMASLQPEVKDKISHRGLATRKLIKELLDAR